MVEEREAGRAQTAVCAMWNSSAGRREKLGVRPDELESGNRIFEWDRDSTRALAALPPPGDHHLEANLWARPTPASPCKQTKVRTCAAHIARWHITMPVLTIQVGTPVLVHHFFPRNRHCIQRSPLLLQTISFLSTQWSLQRDRGSRPSHLMFLSNHCDL